MLVSSVLVSVAAVTLIGGVWMLALHRRRQGERFEALEGQALDDLRNAPGPALPSTTITGPLRFRYVIDGRERLGDRGNPWGLPAVPRLLDGGRVRVWYCRQRDEAFLDVRTTPAPPWALIVAGALLLGLGMVATYGGW